LADAHFDIDVMGICPHTPIVDPAPMEALMPEARYPFYFNPPSPPAPIVPTPPAREAAMQAAVAEMQAGARRSAALILKAAARKYLRNPLLLDILHDGLSMAAPAELIETGHHLVARERMIARRYFGFGGLVPAVNARAVILVGRWKRLADRAMRVAA
jgi:hypothetical protein